MANFRYNELCTEQKSMSIAENWLALDSGTPDGCLELVYVYKYENFIDQALKIHAIQIDKAPLNNVLRKSHFRAISNVLAIQI